jgi:photosystem II biogenesis protein Psp29
VGDCQTVADSKRRFFAAYPRVIPGLYRRVVDELLVELHLLSCQQGFQADALFSLGLTQVFDNFTKGFQPEDRREDLFEALCVSTSLSTEEMRRQASELTNGIFPHGEKEISSWLEARGEGAKCCNRQLALIFITPGSMPLA